MKWHWCALALVALAATSCSGTSDQVYGGFIPTPGAPASGDPNGSDGALNERADASSAATGAAGSGTGAGGAPITPGAGGAATGNDAAVRAADDGGAAGNGGGTAPVQPSLCAVQEVIRSNSCLNCHGATPIAGAPMSLVTYANLTAPAVTDRTKSVGQLVVTRTTARTMPPGGTPAVSAADIQIVQAWVTAGSPSNCPAPAPVVDGGARPAIDAGPRAVADAAVRPVADAGGAPATPPPTGTSANDAWCAVVRDAAPACVQCHGATPRAGVPMSLVSYANWTAAAVSNPALRVGQLALTRMTAGTMPPGGGATAGQLTAVRNWVNGGMANSTCASSGDAGTAPPVVIDPFTARPVCTSMRTMTTPNGPTMRPGEACLNCHTGGGGGDDEGEGAAGYTLAGTVYPTAHEPNDCVGSANGGDAQVRVFDAAGRTINLTPNAVGNFFYSGAVTFPITAQIARNGVLRSMTTGQRSGNCNSCHTQNGANGAPGRILIP